MSKTAKIIISISAIVLAIVTAVLIWMYYPAIKTAINGERYYTLEDVENAYNDGVNDKEEMESQINFYKIEIDKYIKDIADYQSKIKELNASLQDAINSGNADKETIAGLQEDLAAAQADISAKQAQIAELQDDIKFYQELLEAYEDSGKLVVTFTLVDNGVETTHDVQVVEPNGYLTAVVTPTASDFEGWSLSKGGALIEDLTTVQVTENMTVYGMFTNTVTFMVNGEEYATQEVSYNNYATDVEVTLTGYNLNGWSLTDNGEIVTVSTTPITKDTTFYAVLTGNGFTTWEEMNWNGLTSFSASYVWTDSDDIYYSYNTDQYVLNKETSTWEQKTWNGLTNFSGHDIWTDGENFYYSYGAEQYVLNKETSTWQEKTWYGLTNFSGMYVYVINDSVYYSYDDDIHYSLNKETSAWSVKSWNSSDYNFDNIGFNGSCVWNDGSNYYYSDFAYQYVLDIEANTWEEMNWNGRTTINGPWVWTDGTNCYYSLGGNDYVLNKETSTWETITWNVYIDGAQIWTDGTNIYYSSNRTQYVLV